jgi:hypothetical protein
MYRCKICGTVSQPKVSANKVVLSTRPKEYLDANGYHISDGWEIVKEALVCNACKDVVQPSE